MTDSHDGYTLVMPFDTDDPQFRRGFEMGEMNAYLSQGGRGPYVVHADCAEMILRLAESRTLTARTVDLDDIWLKVEFDRKEQEHG